MKDNCSYSVVPATVEDAPGIARVVMMAVGDEITARFAGENHTVGDVHRLFTELAQSDCSQYSWRNTLKAVDPEGNVMGYLVAYDGGRLHELRKAFIAKAREILGMDLEGKMRDETVPGEMYLDSLGVFSQYRGMGVARRLIAAAMEKAREAGLVPGLLCDKTNLNARRLYDSLGFVQVGETLFAGEMMDHMQKRL